MTKHDEGKTRWDLLPMEQVEEIVDVITWGAKKYSDNGWQTLENAEERYFAAMMRHIAAHRRGERFDDESSLSHLAHAGACLLFLIWHDDQKVPEHIVIHDEVADMTAFAKYYKAIMKQKKLKGFKYAND